MNKIKKILTMNAERWQRIRTRGLLYYLLYVGAFLSGVIGGIVYLFLVYFREVGYSFSKFNIANFISEYLVWLPLTITFGILLCFFAWYEFENRFADKKKEDS